MILPSMMFMYMFSLKKKIMREPTERDYIDINTCPFPYQPVYHPKGARPPRGARHVLWV